MECLEFKKLLTRQRIQCGCQLIVILLLPKPLMGTIWLTQSSKWPAGLLFQSMNDFVCWLCWAKHEHVVFQGRCDIKKNIYVIVFLMFLHGFGLFLVFQYNDVVILFLPATSFYQIAFRKSVHFRLVLPSFWMKCFHP